MSNSLQECQARSERCAVIAAGKPSQKARDQWVGMALTWAACAEDIAFLKRLNARKHHEVRIKPVQLELDFGRPRL